MIYIVGILCILYIILHRRIFDFYSISILSSLFYFIPSFFGFIWHQNRGVDIFYDVSPSVILIHGIVLVSLLIGAIINDKFLVNINYRETVLSKYTFVKTIYIISLCFWMIFFIANYSDVLSGKKENFGSLYSVAYTSVTFSIVLSFFRRNWKWFSIFLLIGFLMVYSGEREVIAFSSIAILTLLMMKKGKVFLLVIKY